MEDEPVGGYGRVEAKYTGYFAATERVAGRLRSIKDPAIAEEITLFANIYQSDINKRLFTMGPSSANPFEDFRLNLSAAKFSPEAWDVIRSIIVDSKSGTTMDLKGQGLISEYRLAGLPLYLAELETKQGNQIPLSIYPKAIMDRRRFLKLLVGGGLAGLGLYLASGMNDRDDDIVSDQIALEFGSDIYTGWEGLAHEISKSALTFIDANMDDDLKMHNFEKIAQIFSRYNVRRSAIATPFIPQEITSQLNDHPGGGQYLAPWNQLKVSNDYKKLVPDVNKLQFIVQLCNYNGIPLIGNPFLSKDGSEIFATDLNWVDHVISERNKLGSNFTVLAQGKGFRIYKDDIVNMISEAHMHLPSATILTVGSDPIASLNDPQRVALRNNLRQGASVIVKNPKFFHQWNMLSGARFRLDHSFDFYITATEKIE